MPTPHKPQSKAQSSRNNTRRRNNDETQVQRLLRVPVGLGPILPSATIVDMPWVHSFAQYCDATFVGYTGTQAAIRINNAFEPASSTHQPYGWDQMAALYKQYKVIGFKFEITVQNANSNNNAITLVRPVPYNENTDLNNVSMLSAERPGVRLIPTQYGAPPGKMSFSVDIPKLLGVTKDQYLADVSQYAAQVTAAPTRYAYIQVATQTNELNKYVSVTIKCTYRVQFWQRATQATS